MDPSTLIAAVSIVTAGLTILDAVAQTIHKGIKFVGDVVTGAVKKLIKGVAHFLGRVINTAEDITLAFLRYVLGLLFNFKDTLSRLKSEPIIIALSLMCA